MKHLLAVWLLALLLLPGLALAQDLDEGGYTILDLAATACVAPDGTLEDFDEGGTVPEGFAQRFLLSLGVSSLESEQERRDYLEDFIAAPLPDLAQADENAVLIPAGLQVMSIDLDEDGDAAMVIGQLYAIDAQQNMRYLDARAVAEIQRSDASPLGWQLHRFVIGQELLMEDAAQEYFSGMTVEYYNAACGFAIQYPAIFPEESILEDQTGVNASLPDTGVSFFARREEKTQTIDALLKEKKQEIPSLETNMDEMTGCVRTRYVTGEGQVVIDFYLEGETAVYHAGLIFPEEAQAEYAPYVEYMMNSLTADELGLG